MPARSAEPGNLQLYWVDVEGGAATLIVTPAGESILIDTGMPGERDPQRIIKVAKETARIDRIDHLITTHFHIDHFGGAADVAKALPIANVYDNGIPENNPDNPSDNSRYHGWIKPYREMPVGQRHVIKPGGVIPLKQAQSGPEVSMTCLAAMQQPDSARFAAPSVDCEKAAAKPKDTSDNANSLVFILKYGEFEMFDGGDLSWNTEAALVCPKSIVGPVDIYDVDHHGLDASNNPILINALAPTVAIMSNGTTKGCGPETFATLKKTPSVQAIYQIHKNLREDSQNNTEPEMIANLEKECAANFIQVTVDPLGKSYTVAIPGKGHSKTFATH